ncbi:ABC1 kinase family protein [Tropicibacter oceani]|uniref:AarF/ABC1/UbiB kinase family protein n=1 Tax=Tropicibacter oceani TaxID=3058420 RepID=A0ABY8QMA8_9RHOB|nr:AarF/ABC1/UbiB kinase family protein [Tropicibacter oceani]WGW05073.1 AarF/ABC1/UbiB kinase family protein [Tropicibacter oceani]
MSNDTRSRPVPSSRLSRAARLGGLGAQVLGAMAGGATRQMVAGQRPRARDLLLTPANAARLTNELSRMRGAAMKMGQLLSMESADLLPPELAQILSRLRADAHHMPPKQLKQVLIQAYGADFLRLFQRFDVRPVASASIGQVHRVVARDGRELALKIQYPGVRAAIDADVANLGALLRMSGLIPKGIDIAPLLEEARKQLHEEADYPREAREMRAFGGYLAGDAMLAVPGVHDDLSTGDILAMDFMPGQPIETLAEADQATRDHIAEALFALFLRELFDWGHVQTDPNFANYLFDPGSGRLTLLDFGAARRFDGPAVARFRALMRATLNNDPASLRDAMQSLGYLRAQTPPDQVQTVLDMAARIGAALRLGVVDFGDTRLLEDLRKTGERLGLEQGYREVPQIDALFMQRKLAGLVLLATRLRARVGVTALVEPRL